MRIVGLVGTDHCTIVDVMGSVPTNLVRAYIVLPLMICPYRCGDFKLGDCDWHIKHSFNVFYARASPEAIDFLTIDDAFYEV
jgi:hypothetical protein